MEESPPANQTERGVSNKPPLKEILQNYGFHDEVPNSSSASLISDSESEHSKDASPQVKLKSPVEAKREVYYMATEPNIPLVLSVSIPDSDEKKIAVIMVGLPARGKSYISRRVARYMAWRGHMTRMFNVGNYRRVQCGSDQPHTFFDTNNPEANKAREMCARLALDDMLNWFALHGDKVQIAIYDATNSTRTRREWIRRTCEDAGVKTMFIESFCNDQSIIDKNVRATKVFSPDYRGKDPELAVADFLKRIEMYTKIYEPVDEEDACYVKIIDVGKKVIVNNVFGYLQSKIVSFCMNMRVTTRSIYITRHGQSECNLKGRIGGDSELTELGLSYAERLAEFTRNHILTSHPRTRFWTSTLRRSVQTANTLGTPFLQWRALDELEAGELNGYTYQEIADKMPHEHQERMKDKLSYRYPRGESYQDLILRLDPVIMELERQETPVMIISHQAVLRVLFTYLTEKTHQECPYTEIPLHTVIRLTPTAYGCEVKYYPLGVTPPTSQMHEVGQNKADIPE